MCTVSLAAMDPVTGLLTIGSKTFTYNDFDPVNIVRPSQYEFMASHMLNNYKNIEMARMVYDNLSLAQKNELSEAMLSILEYKRLMAEAKEVSAMNFLIDESEFDPSNPIYHDICGFVRTLVAKYKKEREEYERQIVEENYYIYKM